MLGAAVWLLAATAAFAGVPEDIDLAADSSKPLELRREAFSKLQVESATSTLIRIANDTSAAAGHRWVAVRALGMIPTGEAEVALIALLANPQAPTRIAACLAAGERGDQRLSGRVAARLDDKALLVRQAAADALAQLRDPTTLADLSRALADPSNTYRGTSMWVRRHYVQAMAAIGTDRAIPELAVALRDSDSTVREAAVVGFEKLAGFSYRDGRTPEEEAEAWQRWSKGR